MTQAFTNTRENGIYDPDIPAAPSSRGMIEHQISTDILHLIDSHGTVTRPLVAQELKLHGVCMLRDVLQGMLDMELIETIAGGGIRRCALPARASGLFPRPKPPTVPSFDSEDCEHFS